MRKIVLIAIAVFTFTFAQAQEKVVKIHPVSLAFNIFAVDYEQAVNDKNSFTVGIQYFNWSKYANATGFGAEAGYRWYFSKNNDAPEGIYAAPFFGVNSLTYNGTVLTYDDAGNITGTKDSNESSLFFGGGAQAGYQWIHDSGFALDAYLGYGYYAGEIAGFDSFGGGRPKFGLAVGYAF